MSNDPTNLYCANHPTIGTSLRCNNCEKLICPKCAVLTPTGYRCRECLRGQQKVFNTTNWLDYPLSIAIATILAFIGGLIVSRIGFFTIFLAPFLGMVIGEAIRLVIQRRRSKQLFQLCALGALAGSLVYFLIILLARGFSFYSLLALVWQGYYTVIVTSTVYYRLSGISIR